MGVNLLSLDSNQTPDGKVVDVVASGLPLLKLSKGSDVLELTYGEISALAGDFYGTLNPISDAKSDEDARTRFLAAYNTLADNPADQPHDGQVLIKHLQDEVDKVEALHKEKKDPSTDGSDPWRSLIRDIICPRYGVG
ncbi:hypothetical protein MY1884_006342 [Beauveria asiatica]